MAADGSGPHFRGLGLLDPTKNSNRIRRRPFIETPLGFSKNNRYRVMERGT